MRRMAGGGEGVGEGLTQATSSEINTSISRILRIISASGKPSLCLRTKLNSFVVKASRFCLTCQAMTMSSI